MKDTEYYDKESAQYSQKRYPEVETQYVHFFFKRRLTLLIDFLAKVVNRKKRMSLLEIGCADGFVISAVAKNFDRFDTLIGIDISPQMIRSAQVHRSTDSRVQYFVRGEYDSQDEQFDVIVEIGVLNLTDLSEDLDFVRAHLKEGGYYICSLASSTSLITKLKPHNKEDYKHFISFAEYERILSGSFVVEGSTPYGFFVPHIWKIPVVARYAQPLVEWVFAAFLPNAFHEKIYLLRKR